MKPWILRALFISAIVVAPGCSEKCKNPKIADDIEGGEMIHGPAMQCHAVVTCPGHAGSRDDRIVLQGGNDPVIVDRHIDSYNRNRCIEKVLQNGICYHGSVEASPEIICLDADSGPEGSDGRGSTGILVTVGVASVGSGDWLYDGMGGAGGTGGLGGAGGAGGFSAEPGEGGQDEI